MRSWLRGCLCALALIEGASLMADMRSNYGCLAPNWHDDYDDCVVEYSLLIDRHFSPEVGAENIISAYRLYEMLDCWDIEPDILRCQDAWGFASRAARLVLVDFPVVNLLDVIQHEYFGHGWRARDYGFDPVYSIDVPLPYGDGGGETGITFAEFNSLTLHQKAAWETGGVESTEIMGRILGEKVFACQMMDYREALLYLMAYQDLTLYLYTIRDESEVNDSHDMRAYLLSLREIYGTNAISYNDLRGKAWINLLDPLTWFSAYSLWQYLWSAEKCQEIPVIHWGYGSVLPAIRYSLAPYGPEYGLYSYFCLNHRSGVAYMRYGETEGQTSWAIGVKANDVIDIWDDIRLGGRLDFWWQPKLNTSNPADPGSRVGMAASARATYCLGETWGATMELGGKTWGYLPGESLDADFILRLGVTFYTD